MNDYHPDDPEFFRSISAIGDDFVADDTSKRYGRTDDWDELPAIDKADVARWRGREPREITFTIADLVPQDMVTLLTSIGGAGKTLLLQTACTTIAAGQQTFLRKGAV